MSKIIKAALLIAPLAVLACSCAGPDVEEGTGAALAFVRSGFCVTGLGGGAGVEAVEIERAGGVREEASYQQLGDALIVTHEWEAGAEYQLRIVFDGGRFSVIGGRAPAGPGPALVRSIDLAPHLGAGAEPSAAALSRDGRWCALGTSLGKVLLFDAADGEVAAPLYFAGSYIRSLAFAEIGGRTVLLAGEQSARGAVVAYEVGDGGTLSKLWSFETAAEVGTSRRDPGDPYSWAHLPGIYRILPRRGAALVLAAHPPEGGAERARSALYCIDADEGTLRWRWPAAGPLAAVATWFDADAEGSVVAVCAYEREGGAGIVAQLDGLTGREVDRLTVRPLRPRLERVNFWRSVSVSPGGGRIGVLSDDGRAWLWIPDGEAKSIVLAAPLDVGGVPLMVSGAGVVCGPVLTFFATGTTYLPWHLTDERRPPQPHPDALKLIAVDEEGEAAWAAGLPNLAQGLEAGPARRWIFAGYASDPVFSPEGGSGLAIFDGTNAEAPLAASFPVGGGVMHGSPCISGSGRLVMLVEVTQRDAGGEETKGRNAIHILCW